MGGRNRSRIPGAPPIRASIVAAVTRCPGLIAADYARRLGMDYNAVSGVLSKLLKAGQLRKLPITDQENAHFGKQGYFLPL